jgi:hypothetical protein
MARKMKAVTAYRAQLTSLAGGPMLLGGSHVVRSSPFRKKSDAEAWADQAVATNEQAGRPVHSVRIEKGRAGARYVVNAPLKGARAIGSNMTEVEHGDLTVLYSYETPVAFLSPQGGYVTETRWSVTTSKHIAKFFARHGYDRRGAHELPQKDLEAIISVGELRDFDELRDFPINLDPTPAEQAEAVRRLTRRRGNRPRRDRYVLVYQAGIANVFRVTSFNLADYGRDAVRLVQSDFRSAEAFARGLAAAGGIVKSAACNRAGDITHEKWTDDLDSQPFSDKFHPVDSSKGLSRRERDEQGPYDVPRVGEFPDD